MAEEGFAWGDFAGAQRHREAPLKASRRHRRQGREMSTFLSSDSTGRSFTAAVDMLTALTRSSGFSSQEFLNAVKTFDNTVHNAKKDKNDSPEPWRRAGNILCQTLLETMTCLIGRESIGPQPQQVPPTPAQMLAYLTSMQLPAVNAASQQVENSEAEQADAIIDMVSVDEANQMALVPVQNTNVTPSMSVSSASINTVNEWTEASTTPLLALTDNVSSSSAANIANGTVPKPAALLALPAPETADKQPDSSKKKRVRFTSTSKQLGTTSPSNNQRTLRANPTIKRKFADDTHKVTKKSKVVPAPSIPTVAASQTNFDCDTCDGKSFDSMRGLLEHKLEHSGLHCPVEGCPRAKRPYVLKKPLLTHLMAHAEKTEEETKK